MADGDYDTKTRSDAIYAERRIRTVKVEAEGVPKGTTEEVTDWRWCWDKPGGKGQAICGPWVVNKLEAMRQGIEYSRTGHLIEVLTSQ